VELLSKDVECMYIGISRPNLDPTQGYMDGECTDGWFISMYKGALCGNGEDYNGEAGLYNQGDRVGVLLDLNDGSLRFFKNGVQQGPGYAAGSVTGPVVAAVQMSNHTESVRLLPSTCQRLKERVQWAARRECSK
jgi:hypothetical protein